MGKYAFQYLEKAALQGDAEAQFMLGNMYAEGDGVEKDTERAKEWYEKAAAQGYEQAKSILNAANNNGQTEQTQKDNAESPPRKRWAILVTISSICLLILTYFYYVERSPSLYWLYAWNNPDSPFYFEYCGASQECLEKAVDYENAYAMVDFGRKYAEGDGVEKNAEQAKKYYKKAADKNDAEVLNYMIEKGISYYRENNFQQAKDLFENIVYFDCWRENSDSSCSDYRWTSTDKARLEVIGVASYYLGRMYETGEGVEEDLEKAKKLYRHAAYSGNYYALDRMTAIGWSYCHPFPSTKPDFQQAKDWFEAAPSQLPDYIDQLPDDEKSLYTYIFKSIWFQLGVMYSNGQGVEQDYKKAIEWYEKAAALGDATAQYNLGVIYHNGEGIRQDFDKAKEWYGKSCDNGFQDGCKWYKKLNNRW